MIDFSGIMSNPTYAKVQEGVKVVQENHVDFILAVGGGSVIDCCKIISAQAKLDEDIWEMEKSKEGLSYRVYSYGSDCNGSRDWFRNECRRSNYA